MSHIKKVLFFIMDCVPTKTERKQAEVLASATRKVSFRNVKSMGPDDATEQAEFFVGAVPASYLAEHKKAIRLELPAIDADGNPVSAPAALAEVPAAVPAPVAPSVATGTEETAALTPPAATLEVLPPTADEQIAIDRRAQEDAGAQTATVAQLKQALTDLGIAFKTNTAKADLLALYLAR